MRIATQMLDVLVAAWGVLAAMAPYLLVGFAVAGVLSVLITPERVRRHMGRRGIWQVVKASLLGVPLPLCSCGVIPVGLSLRRAGASRGATISFVASTPQTGVDSIAATYALLGPVLTAIRLTAAFLSGVLAGLLAQWGEDADDAVPAEESANGGPAAMARPAWQRMLRHGLVVLPRDVAWPLLFGVLVSGALTALLPAGLLAGAMPAGWLSYGAALAIGLPLYVCSMSSIPLAAGFVHLGVSPGAALVFLISGPATNAATVAALWSRVGHRATLGYLAGISLTALCAGWLLDRCFPQAFASVPALTEHCAAGAQSAWQSVLALLLLALLVPGLWPQGGRPLAPPRAGC